MSIPTQACPVTLQPWQGYYNGWLFGSGTPYNILEVSKGFDMVALGSQDSQYPRQTGEIIGLDVAKGRDLDLHFWVAPVGQNPAPGGLLKIMEEAVRVQGYVEEPLWLYIPPWPILAFMVRARKRSFPLDLNFSTAGLIKPSLSFHATDPIGYANLKTSDLTAPTANLLTGEDATFIGGVGSWTGSNVTLSNTTSETLGTSSSLEIVPVTNADPASISTAQGTSSQYQVSGLAGQEITVMASMRSAVAGTFAFQLGVEFYDLAGNSLSNVQSPVFADSPGFWSLISFGTNVPATAATLAVNVTTDALNGTHYLSDVGVFAMSPSANLAADTSTLSTWTLGSGFGIAASPLGGNEITFDGSGSSSSSSQAIYLKAQTQYVISSYLDASNATAGSISMEVAGYSATQDFANTGTVSATFTATNTGMYQITYNTSGLTVGSGLAVSFAQPQVEVGATPSNYVPGQNWFLGAGTGGLIYPVTYPVVYQTQSKKFVAQNNGNWPVYPRVTMTGPLNLPTLTVGSQSFALDNNQNPTIPEGYQVAIDMQTHAVIYSAVGQTEGTNYLSWVTNSSDWLTIPVGGADVEFASGAQDTGSCIFESADGWFM